MSASNIQRKHFRENVSFFLNDLLTTVEPQFITLGTRGFSRVQGEFSVLAERRSHGNRARKVSGTQGTSLWTLA